MCSYLYHEGMPQCLTCYNNHLLRHPTTCHEDGIFGVIIWVFLQNVYNRKGEITLVTERCQVMYLTKAAKGHYPLFRFEIILMSLIDIYMYNVCIQFDFECIPHYLEFSKIRNC